MRQTHCHEKGALKSAPARASAPLTGVPWGRRARACWSAGANGNPATTPSVLWCVTSRPGGQNIFLGRRTSLPHPKE